MAKLTRFSREHNHSWEAIIDLCQALVFYQEDNLGEAARLCERADAFLMASPLRGKLLLCQLLIARIRLASGEAVEAKRICLAALPMLDQTESPVLHYQACFVFGSIEEALSSIEAAYERMPRRTNYRKACVAISIRKNCA